MRVLLDTNIVVRNANRDDPQHGLVAGHVQRLVEEGRELCIAAQTVFEFWVVATRPADVNGLGFSPGDARRNVDLIVDAYSLLADPPDLMARWLDLCTRYEVRGRQAHDARLVACMLSHQIGRLLTLNVADFARYPEIECLTPHVA